MAEGLLPDLDRSILPLSYCAAGCGCAQARCPRPYTSHPFRLYQAFRLSGSARWWSRPSTARLYRGQIPVGNKPCVEQSDRSTAATLILGVIYAVDGVLRALGDGLMVTTGFTINNHSGALCYLFLGTQSCSRSRNGSCHLNYAQIHFASVAAFVAGWRSS